MCLDGLETRNEDPEAEGFGYKVFMRKRYELKPMYAEYPDTYEVGKPYQAREDKSVRLAEIHGYTPGFHIFERVADARIYCVSSSIYTVRKVHWKGFLACGCIHIYDAEGNYTISRVIVAQEMTIL